MTDVIIIGAGPAGIAAAIQLRRYAIGFNVFERDSIGGLLLNANLIENYPGFPRGISGSQLVKLFGSHLQELDIEVTDESVNAITDRGNCFDVITDSRKYSCKIAVLATGTRPILSDIKGTNNSDRVYYDVTQLQHITGKRIAIVGAGDAAFDYALNLSQNNRVVINNRHEKISSLPLLVKRVDCADSVEYRHHCTLTEIDDQEDGLNLTWSHDGSEVVEQYDYLLFAIGREPNLSCIGKPLQTKLSRLEKAGRLYLIGDVKNGLYRQASISIGDGIKAAMQIYRNDNKVI